MKIATIILAVLFVIVAGAGSYMFIGKYQPLEKKLHQANLNNSNLERNITDLNHELNLKVAEISKAKSEKEEEISSIESTKDSLVQQMQSEIDANQIQITQLADKLKVSILDKILFPSGETKITTDGLEVLKRVGDILKNVENKIIRVEGHTDNVPILGRLQEKFPTNWELSTARATNVVRFLEEQVHMDPARLEAVGIGEHKPIASNETEEGKAKNRRIEIALLPIR